MQCECANLYRLKETNATYHDHRLEQHPPFYQVNENIKTFCRVDTEKKRLSNERTNGLSNERTNECILGQQVNKNLS